MNRTTSGLVAAFTGKMQLEVTAHITLQGRRDHVESRDIEVKLKLSKSEYEFVKEFAQQVQLSLEDLILLALLALNRAPKTQNHNEKT